MVFERRETLKGKIGYASAGITDAATFTFVGSYLLFFLTTVAGIDPITAGTLTAIGSIGSSIWSPVVGFLSDHCRSKLGKRRFFLITASVPLAAALILCFTDLEMNQTLKNIYYGLMILLFWCSFSTFYGPWLALGAEFTRDYNERTALRSIAYGVNMAGTIFGMAAPPVIVDAFCRHGMSAGRAWQVTAAIIACIALAAISFTIAASGDKDCPAAVTEQNKGNSVRGVFRDYAQVLKLKPVRYILGACLCHMTAQGIFFSDRLYFFSYNLHMSSAETTGAIVLFSACSAVWIFPVMMMSRRLDKRSALIVYLVFSAVGCAGMDKVIGIDGFPGVVAVSLIFAVGNSAFWQLMPVMLYDVCEYDALYTGHRREGIIVSIQPLMETICSGLASLVLGAVLQACGFDETAAQQPQAALDGIAFAFAVLPAVLMVGCALMTYFYPITKKRYEEIRRGLEERKRCEDERDARVFGKDEKF